MRSKGVVVLLSILALVGAAAPASAARFSGEYLLSMCGSDRNGRELAPGGHIACQAYIAGVLDYNNLIRSLGTAPSVDFCVPEGVSMNDLQEQVVSYLLRNREDHAKFIAAPGVALALFEIFPCKGTTVRKGKPK